MHSFNLSNLFKRVLKEWPWNCKYYGDYLLVVELLNYLFSKSNYCELKPHIQYKHHHLRFVSDFQPLHCQEYGFALELHIVKYYWAFDSHFFLLNYMNLRVALHFAIVD